MTGIRSDDLCAIITGGARGIGAATARWMARQGAHVMITDILDEEGKALAEEIGSNAMYRRLDVTSPADWEVAATTAQKEFGKVNALFNNAGILALGSVVDCTPDEFRHVIEVNLTGVFLGIQSIAPVIAQAGGGAIVNNSSTAGLQGYGGLAAYVTSKWGIRGLTKAAALDLAGDGIRVMSLHPGPIRTPMTEGMGDNVVAAQPIPRFGDADEVARMATFMFTDASFSTGSEFVVDGGAVAGQVLHLEA